MRDDGSQLRKEYISIVSPWVLVSFVLVMFSGTGSDGLNVIHLLVISSAFALLGLVLSAVMGLGLAYLFTKTVNDKMLKGLIILLCYFMLFLIILKNYDMMVLNKFAHMNTVVTVSFVSVVIYYFINEIISYMTPKY